MWIRQQLDDGTEKFVADGNNSEVQERITEWEPDVDAALGRGATDTSRSYLRLRRSDGTSVYIYVDTGTTVSCSTTKP